MIAAHDDDVLLCAGGTIARYREMSAEVRIVIVTDGSYSHRAVLDISTDPTPREVARVRKHEIREAMAVLAVPGKNIMFLDFKDGAGNWWRHNKRLKGELAEIMRSFGPDAIFFNAHDAHADHTAVNTLIYDYALPAGPRRRSLDAYEFAIWTRRLSRDRQEVNPKNIAVRRGRRVQVNIAGHQTVKRCALFKMRSQVEIWPYADWQIQTKPILSKPFLDSFLTHTEIFTKV